jgi:hypothetical protein
VGDLNGDGKPDLAVSNKINNTVSVLSGNGDGTFQPQQTYAVGSESMSVAIGDFNGDGRRDLAVADGGANTVSLLLNQSTAVPVTIAVSVSARTTAAGSAFTVTASAKDASGHVQTAYNGPATWSDTSGSLSPATPADFVNGVSTTTIASVANMTHADQITVTSGGASGTSGAFNVTGPLASVTVGIGGKSTVAPGSPFTVTAYAFDALGDLISTYNAPATWSDRSGSLSPAAPSNFVNGVSTTTNASIATPTTSDKITITTGGVSGTSTAFGVR